MRTYRVPGPDPVVIDVCPGCQGTWLDPGEVARLRAAARARIVPKVVGEVAADQAGRPVHPRVPVAAAAQEEVVAGTVDTVFGALREIVDILRGRR